MHFSSLFTPVVALLATAASASPIEKRAVTADQMVTAIKAITQQSKSLTTVANNINPMNGVPLLGPSSGSGSTNFNDLISGLQGIITTASTDIQNMDGTAPYTDAAAEQKVCDAFSNVSLSVYKLPLIMSCTDTIQFVVVHQNLLKVLIGKSGLLEGIFLGPVAAALRSLEGVVDVSPHLTTLFEPTPLLTRDAQTLAFGIIDSVPVCADKATADKSNLDDTLGKAICAYTPAGSLGLNLFC
jgi:hypothetical protein